MSKKDRKIILIAQCLVNPYCRVHVLGQNFPFSRELAEYLMQRKIGIIQYLCPETTAMGLKRNPQGRQQYDSIFFRNHCKELLQSPMLMVREFIRDHYRLVAFLGLENSPTCGIHWGKHKVNKYGTESPMSVDDTGPGDPKLMGIMAEILTDQLKEENIHVPFIELPAKSEPQSEQRKQFWEELRRAVEPQMVHDTQ